MQNLNDYYYFAQVVKYQGFTKASEALGVTKSKLSRHISDLESRLKVRLLQRSTRKFAVTAVGQEFFEYCIKILDQVEVAENFVEQSLSSEPSGLVRISCPIGLVEFPLGNMVAQFMQLYPRVQVHLVATNRKVDLIEEGIDLAVRVRNFPLEDSDLIVRELDAWQHVLVATPGLSHQMDNPINLDNLAQLPSIGFHAPKSFWRFKSKVDATAHIQEVEFFPRLKTDNFAAMKAAVLNNVGIASLPRVFVYEEINSGTLVELVPEWELPRGVIHVAYTSRQGMMPAVRCLLEYLIEEFKKLSSKKHENT